MTTSDLPPAYNSLHTSTANIAAEEEIVPICEEDDEVSVNYSFQDDAARSTFMQKVLAIKLLQSLGVVMVMTFFVLDNYCWGVVIYFLHRENNHVHVFVLSTLAYVLIFGLLMYCDQARRTNPYRFVFLVAYPLSYTFLICFTILWCECAEISAAFYYYCAAVFALLIYITLANRSKQEFFTRYGTLISSVVLVFMFVITVPFLYHRNVFYIVYATIAAGVDLVFLLFNLEKMTSKHYRTIISPSDFVDAAINLHVDFYYTIFNFIVPKVKHGFEKISAELMIEREERNETPS